MGLEIRIFCGTTTWISDYEQAFPAYLYDLNPLDKVWNYLLNVDVTKSSLHVLLRLALRKPSPMSLDDLTLLPPKKPERPYC